MKRKNPFTVTLPQGPVSVKTFVAIGPYCWGNAKTMKEAIANCLRYGGKLKPDELNVYALSSVEGVEVTDMGHLHWPAGTVCMQVQTSTIAQKEGR